MAKICGEGFSVEEARRLLEHGADGLLRWRERRGGEVKAGDIACRMFCDGRYRRVTFNSRTYLAHRVAWAIHHGDWPELEIDHINGIKTDNRLENMRLASRTQNCANTGKTKKAALKTKGVCLHRTGRFQAQIVVGGKNIYLGLFDSEAEAGAAYEKKARETHGEYAWGRP